MTRQRSTFTGKRARARAAERNLCVKRGAGAGEKRSVELARAQFAQTRFSTMPIASTSPTSAAARPPATPRRSVFEAEGYVMRAAEGLAANKTHGLSEEQRFRHTQRRAA